MLCRSDAGLSDWLVAVMSRSVAGGQGGRFLRVLEAESIGKQDEVMQDCSVQMYIQSSVEVV